MDQILDGSAIQVTQRQKVKQIVRARIANSSLRSRYRRLSPEKRAALFAALKEYYFGDPYYYADAPDVYLASPEGTRDMADHLMNRLEEFRSLVVPWLSSLFSLDGAKIIEIGCGTGASSVSLAEQGADVIGVDVSQTALQVARIRTQLHDVRASFVRANASELEQVAEDQRVDAVIFFAAMEHMTWKERLESLAQAWRLLQSGKYLVIVETPNRLWHTDTHTSLEPFFHWLPDDVAMSYSCHTRRSGYNTAFVGVYTKPTEEESIRFARWGRGVSYHDLVIALNVSSAGELPLASAMQKYLNTRSVEQFIRNVRSHRYRRLLHKLAPEVNPGFLYEDLYVALRKP